MSDSGCPEGDGYHAGALRQLAPSHAPQSPRCEDGGEGRVHAERDERPDPKIDSARTGDPSADDSRALHVEDDDAQPEDPQEEHDDVARSPVVERESSVQEDDEDHYPPERFDRSRLQPAGDLVHPVRCKEDDRQQRRDD